MRKHIFTSIFIDQNGSNSYFVLVIKSNKPALVLKLNAKGRTLLMQDCNSKN